MAATQTHSHMQLSLKQELFSHNYVVKEKKNTHNDTLSDVSFFSFSFPSIPSHSFQLCHFSSPPVGFSLLHSPLADPRRVSILAHHFTPCFRLKEQAQLSGAVFTFLT